METLILLLDVLWRRRRFALGVFLLVAMGGIAGAYLMRPTFESSAKLLINLESRGVSIARAEVQRGGAVVQAVEEVTTQVEILKSRDLIEKLVDKLGEARFKEPPPDNLMVWVLWRVVDVSTSTLSDVLQTLRLTEAIDPRDALIEKIDKALTVYPVRQAQVIIVSFRWRNPQIPPEVLKALLDLYLEKGSNINSQFESFALFTEQTRRASLELETVERKLRDLELRYDVTDLRREKQLLLERIEKLTTLTEGVGAPALPDRVAGSHLTQASPADPDATIVGAQISQLRSQLSALQIERSKAVVTYTSNHRIVRELDNQIASIEAALGGETKSLSATLKVYKTRLATLQAAETEFNRAIRNVEMATEAYQTYRKVAEDRRVTLAEEARVKIQVVDPPSIPFRPLRPGRLLIALGALAFALVAAVLLTFLRHFFATSWTDMQLRARQRANRAAQDAAALHDAT